MLVMLEACFATHVFVNVFLPSVAVLYLDDRIICFFSGFSDVANPSLHFSSSGAILLYNQSDFGSYGTASLASNETKYGGAM